MINPTSAVPLYVQVADDLRRRIEMGEFSESGVLPSENGFCEEDDTEGNSNSCG